MPVSGGIGDVIAVGAGVTAVTVGDRATAVHSFATWLGGSFAMSAFAHDLGITHDGWLAEQIVIPAALVKVPDSVTDDQAAAPPAAGVTAWNAVVEVGKARAGDTVLALGTDGVSIFALQIARLRAVLIDQRAARRVVIAATSETAMGKRREASYATSVAPRRRSRASCATLAISRPSRS